MYSVHYGKAKQHKGWTKESSNYQESLYLKIHQTGDGSIITRTTKLSDKDSVKAIKKRTGSDNKVIFSEYFPKGTIALHLHEEIKLLDKSSPTLLSEVKIVIEDYIGEIDDKEEE